MTGFDGSEAILFGSFIRFGRGESIVDNAHAGGIFCTVDIETGEIISDGHDTSGNTFENHPDTGIRFKGFMIPHWKRIAEECCKMHLKFDLPFVGWDIALSDNGRVEFVEGNHGPDVDIIQGPTKTGCRDRFVKICKRYKSHKK